MYHLFSGHSRTVFFETHGGENGVVTEGAVGTSGGSVPYLTCRGIEKRYGAVQALSEVDFDVARGEVVALIGDNGAGKSTLVKIISGYRVRRQRDHQRRGPDGDHTDPP